MCTFENKIKSKNSLKNVNKLVCVTAYERLLEVCIYKKKRAENKDQFGCKNAEF